MAATIVNDIRNLPPTIIVGELNRFNQNGISTAFLDSLVKLPKNEIGIKTYSYYIINTNVRMRARIFDQQFMTFKKLMDACFVRGFKFMMIRF